MSGFFEVGDMSSSIQAECADKKFTQAMVARTYALAMMSGNTNWAAANRAIIDRWSMSGLERVKKMAFDLVKAA